MGWVPPTKDATVNGVLQRAPFSSQSYFTKWFGRLVGAIPRAYRERSRRSGGPRSPPGTTKPQGTAGQFSRWGPPDRHRPPRGGRTATSKHPQR